MHGGGPGGGPRGGGPNNHFYRETDEKTSITLAKFKRIFNCFKPYRKQLIVLFFAILITSSLGVIPTIITRNIIDSALPNHDIKQLLLLISLSFGTVMVLELIKVGQSYSNSMITENIIKDLRQQMYNHLQNMSLNFYSNIRSGEITSRINNDIGGVERVFSQTFISIVRNVFIFVTTAVTLFATNWIMALVSITILPVFIIPTKKVGKKRWLIAKTTQEHMANLNNLVNDTLNVSGATLVKLYTKEESQFEKFSQINKKISDLRIKETLVGRWFFMFISIFTTLGPLLIYLIGGLLLIVNGSMTVGSIVMFVTLLGRVYGPITAFSNLHVDITRSFALFDRIYEYLDTPCEIVEGNDARDIYNVSGKIKFNNVCFTYSKKSKVILKNINIDIKQGQMIAFIGPSGAGKTTITKLIPRLYDATTGNIELDGISIKEYTLHSLRKNISMVTQDTFLFNTTIKKNLLFACGNATDIQIENACKAAYIHDFIMTLPNGYDTIVGERGVKLSGGEKQRISIARAILKNPRIVIFDEATSSLDSTSEEFIQLAMKPLLKGKTSLIIAHRLSTILNADRIYVIDDGKIVESGTHVELINQNSLYNKLYETQFKL